MDRPTRLPRLVLVHGTRMSRAQWEPYRALLPELELITVDLPGHGARVAEEFTGPAALATIEVAVREAAAPGSDGALPPPPVLVGHSLGGYLAALWAAERSDRLGALVLVGASADPAGPLTGVYRGFARVVPRMDGDRLGRGMNLVFRALGARGEHAAALPDGAAYASLPAAWSFVIDHAGPGLLDEVTCPVVLLNGQLDQMRLHARRYAAHARDARVVTVRGATHLMPATHPRQVAAVLRRAALAVGG